MTTLPMIAVVGLMAFQRRNPACPAPRTEGKTQNHEDPAPLARLHLYAKGEYECVEKG
ncbi:hypothetical protein [Nonomuraea sp. CA-141351]|uniref:hypothetical protein n=1 Tax=Nonomuraea sp. CA-141351 TaxID=3239996 RepID=UPI003D91AD68